MAAPTKYIQATHEHAVTFSVCSLVRDVDRYDVLLESFEKFGFTTANSEFFAADNREVNQFDGYNWHKRMHTECSGEYIIYCHEDVELIGDGFDDLVARLRELEEHDPRWLVAGVAGAAWRVDNGESRRQILHISDGYGNDRLKGVHPGRVESLDECFLVVRRDRPVFGSYDLSGFHYYGADLCFSAELAGGTAYAIDFHLKHHGESRRGPPFRQCRRAFAQKYSKIYPGRLMYCTTGPVQFGGGWYDLV
ncbi:MAG: hypothetical protein AAF092_13920 [Pseudomonadota bacterium]